MTANTGVGDRGNGAPQDGQETLKYQLLGPSLTKAGQDTVDQQKASNILLLYQPSSYVYQGFRDHIQCVERFQILQPRGSPGP